MTDEVPVKVDEVHEVHVKAVGEKGDGIVRVNGFVIFVPNTKKGDYVKIKITKVLPKVGFAQVLEKLERPKRKSKFTTITKDELDSMPEEESSYEDTDDFGEDLDDDE